MLLPPGKVAVVTGIGPGLGKEIALGLARLGTRLAIGARTVSMLDETKAECEALGAEVIALRTDLASREDCHAIVEAAAGKWGTVDILIQNGHHPGNWTSVEAADPEFWRATIDVNLFGALHLFQACLPYFRKQQDGRVVFVNSGAANNRPPMGLAAYAAGKAAMASLVRSIAIEHGRDGIRCNGTHMGVMVGGNVQPWFESEAVRTGKSLEDYMEAYYDQNLPLRYVPPPVECAGGIIFLASDMARVITGQAISINGGEWFGT